MDLADILIISAVSIWIYMSLFYLLAGYLKNAGIIDIGWGLGFILITIVLLLFCNSPSLPQALVSIYVILWGTRLFLHILTRAVGKSEDWRYAAWRKDWGKNFWWRSYVQIFMLQGLLMLIVAAPLYVVSHHANDGVAESIFFTTLGSIVWWYGFIFESVGDWQLRKFIRNPKNKGKIMDQGFWRFTRHPNYFGEVIQWWGLWIIVLPLVGGIYAVVSPVLITVLILKVSGITMLESKYDKNKKYQAYKKKTSAFFPLPQKKTSSK